MLPSLSERPAHMSWGRQVRGTAQALAQDSVGAPLQRWGRGLGIITLPTNGPPRK